MRPIRLEVQGLTSYRETIVVDFTELDLFAITGPTGAGKSSLVDAITFALFGQVPRVGRNVKELISQGADRLKVSLEFSSNGDTYRIHRASARKGQAPVQLERLDAAAGEWMPMADRVAEATSEIEALLRMDYDAFIRSVLLPQGEFQEFLAGDRDQRRKVLDGLLQLGLYAAMQQRANALAARHGDDADRIRQRLETELRDATPETLEAARTEHARLKTQAEQEAAAREALEAAHRLGETMEEARTKERGAREAAREAEEALEKARAILGTGEESLKELDTKITEVRTGIKDAAYDQGAHLRLTQCLPLLREMELAEEREKKLGDDIAKATSAMAQQVEQAKAATSAYQTANAAAEQDYQAYIAAGDGNAAARLQAKLKAGDPCPVCGHAVEHLEKHEIADITRLKAAADAAKAAEKKADAAMRDIDTTLTRSQQALEGFEKQLADAQADHARRSDELEKLLPEPGLTTAAVEARITSLDVARTKLEALTGDEKRLVEERETQAQSIANAQKDVSTREAEVKAQTGAAEGAAKQASEAEKAIRAVAREKAWDDVLATLDSDGDLRVLLGQRLEVARSHEREAATEAGRIEERIKTIEANIEKARELAEEEKTNRDAALLARDLASLLRADRFPTFIRERALQTLARDGSQRLEEISNGRYEFAVEGQDFLIVDRWNGGESRSVRTLSGGETFLASLALALALAEHLPALTSGGAGGTLESLFIDEGFSHLDEDTLNTVASALEVLGQDRRRLIGVITHVPALAERMPARIMVHKAQSGSTVTVE